ncbi:RidA family protein [Erysipelothrix sp. HDW6C]|uniref:RidA family protein n=1 Tax=Erysipelothrix sp. HDW6C TaxID=2714930 RepID=UPI00140AE0A7|nr:RidA family protein [Erysipelothrix sp. HDW6C]QIK69587.1 RidA family protein [Erysipelothrix sp. HDW6C]
MNKITRKTPLTVNAPVGKYAHITKIPAGLDWYAFSGQIGVDADGNISEDFNTQVRQTFQNIHDVLEHEGLTPADIVKVNIWSVSEIDWDFFYATWDTFFNEDYPSMTIAYITALGLPEIKLEIDVWAAK